MSEETTTDGEHLDDETLAALADGEVTGPSRSEAEAHLASCAACSFRRADLDAARRLIGSEVPSLPPAMRDALVLKALSAASGGSGADGRSAAAAAGARTSAPARPLPAPGDRYAGRNMILTAAAVIAVVAVVGAGIYGAVRLADHPSTSAGSATATTIAPPFGRAAQVLAVVEVRPEIASAKAGCSAQMSPPAGQRVTLPDVVDAPGRKPACLRLGPAIASLSVAAHVAEQDAGTVPGPETVIVTVGGIAARSLARAHGLPKRAGPRLVVVADGAAVGYLDSIGPVRHDGTVEVVFGAIDPAVGAYISASLGSG